MEDGRGGRWSRVTMYSCTGCALPKNTWLRWRNEDWNPFLHLFTNLYLVQSCICQEKEFPLSNYYKVTTRANHRPEMNLLLNLLHVQCFWYNQIEMSVEKLGIQVWIPRERSELEIQRLESFPCWNHEWMTSLGRVNSEKRIGVGVKWQIHSVDHTFCCYSMGTCWKQSTLVNTTVGVVSLDKYGDCDSVIVGVEEGMFPIVKLLR